MLSRAPFAFYGAGGAEEFTEGAVAVMSDVVFSVRFEHDEQRVRVNRRRGYLTPFVTAPALFVPA